MTQTTQQQEEAKANARVGLFRTQAVGIVDKAANGEMFLAMKSAGMDGQQAPQAGGTQVPAEKAPEAPAAAPPATALKMPAAAKQAMTTALGAVIDTCAKMAEALQAAVVDDSAPVPPELVQMAMAAEDQLGALVEPYEEAMMAAPPPAPPVEGEPAQKADAPAPPAPKPPRPRLAMKRIAAMDGVAKALMENAAKVGELVGWAKGMAGMAAPATKAADMCESKKADLDPYTAMSATAAAVKERMYCIRDMLESDPAAVANELRQLIPMVDSLAQLVTQARSGAMAPPAGAPAAAAPPAPPVAEMATEAVQKAVTATIDGLKADLLSAMKAEMSGFVVAAKGAAATAQGAAATAQAALQKVEKSVPAPAAKPAGEITTLSTGTAPQADPWRTVNQDIQQARTGATGK